MKAIVSLTVVGLVLGWSSAMFGQDEQKNMLAEMEKCAVCKHLAAKPELMKEMTWETHKIDNGMLCLSTVPKDMRKEFAAVNEKMMDAIKEVKADAKEGKPVELCEVCASVGELMKAGAKQQHIETSTGAIQLCTSDDPAIVKKIHEVADKAIAIQKKIRDSQKTAAR